MPCKWQRLGTSATPAGRLSARRISHVWALDYQFDVTSTGRILKFLHVVDEYTRESLSDLAGYLYRFRTQCRVSELRFGAVGRLRQDRGSCLSVSCTWLWSGSLAGWSCWGAARRPRTPRSSCCGTR